MTAFSRPPCLRRKLQKNSGDTESPYDRARMEVRVLKRKLEAFQYLGEVPEDNEYSSTDMHSLRICPRMRGWFNHSNRIKEKNHIIISIDI